MHKIIIYGKPNHVFTTSTMVLAKMGSENQVGLIPKSAFNTMFISPKLWLNNPLKMRIEMKDGTA